MHERARALRRVFYYRSESAVLLINQSLIYLACYRVVFVRKHRPLGDIISCEGEGEREKERR